MNRPRVIHRLRTVVLVIGLLLGTLLTAHRRAVADTTIVPATLADPQTQTVVSVQPIVRQSDAQRFGINLGAHDQYGAGQILRNIIPNPGFEGAEFGMVTLLAPGAIANRMQADLWNTAWNNDAAGVGQPIDFWNGGSYEIVNGPAAGRRGTITDFAHEESRYTFYLDSLGVWPQTENIAIVRTQRTGINGQRGSTYQGDTTTKRPGSPGAQSLKLLSAGNSWTPSYSVGIDTYARDGDASAGKLLVVDGTWRISIWARAATYGEVLTIRFRRLGEQTFLDLQRPLTTEWQLIEQTFTVADGIDGANRSSSTNALAFELVLSYGSGPMWVDDVVLERIAGGNNPTVFSDALVEQLRGLQPGVIRNWGAQLGSSLDNQLAEPFARRTSGFNPNDRVGRNYHYSLHEFLTLCAAVGADPWYVIPPSWTPEELANLMAYLNAPVGSHAYANKRAALGRTAPWSEAFDTIHLELGNEIWGAAQGSDPFLGATVRGGVRAGQFAHLRYGVLRSSAYFAGGDFDLVLGGQTFYPLRQQELETNSSNHDTIGLAPYFGQVTTYSTPETLFADLYAHSRQTVTSSPVLDSKAYIDAAGQGTQIAIYELNLLALNGTMPLDVRNAYVAGQGGGVALPLTMMNYQAALGVRTIAAYQALQYSKQISAGVYVRSFGLLRDLEATGRQRPTWQAMALANRAVRGDLLTTAQSGSNPFYTHTSERGSLAVPYVQSFAYRDGSSYALALYNLHPATPQQVQLDLPTAVAGSATRHELSHSDWLATNEETQNVSVSTTAIGDFANGYMLTLPPHSMTVIEWTSGAAVPTVVGLAGYGAAHSGLPAFVWLAWLLLLAVTLRAWPRRRQSATP